MSLRIIIKKIEYFIAVKKSKNYIIITYDDEHDYNDGYPIDVLNIDIPQVLITKNTYDADTVLKFNLHL